MAPRASRREIRGQTQGAPWRSLGREPISALLSRVGTPYAWRRASRRVSASALVQVAMRGKAAVPSVRDPCGPAWRLQRRAQAGGVSVDCRGAPLARVPGRRHHRGPGPGGV
jgi:hypothetical protein